MKADEGGNGSVSKPRTAPITLSARNDPLRAQDDSLYAEVGMERADNRSLYSRNGIDFAHNGSLPSRNGMELTRNEPLSARNDLEQARNGSKSGGPKKGIACAASAC